MADLLHASDYPGGSELEVVHNRWGTVLFYYQNDFLGI